MPEEELFIVDGLRICNYCLDGKGGECHTPGCMLILNRAPDLPLRENIIDQGGTIREDGDSSFVRGLITGIDQARARLHNLAGISYAVDERLGDAFKEVVTEAEKQLETFAANIRKENGRGEVITCPACQGQAFEIHGGTIRCTNCGRFIKLMQEYLNLDNEENSFSIDVPLLNEDQARAEKERKESDAEKA